MLDFTKLDEAVTDLENAKEAVKAYIAGVGQILLDNAANQAKITEIGILLVEDAETIANDIILANTPPTP